ncbi:mycothiol-dependent nitroreductase Rv2466c family protein [Tsukamurella paurometabola]
MGSTAGGPPSRADDTRARASLQLCRVLVAASTGYGAALGPLYDSLGVTVHENGIRDFDLANREALRAAGLPAELVSAASSTDHDAVLRDNTAEALAIVGPDVGTPVIEMGGAAVFGPILSRVPAPADAVRILDAVATLVTAPHFVELKRNRTEEPVFRTP